MSGHHPFSNLTANFSSRRKDKIAQQTERLKTEMSLSKLQMSDAERHRKLVNMSDEDIDYSDIPELDEDFFQNAKLVARILPIHPVSRPYRKNAVRATQEVKKLVESIS